MTSEDRGAPDVAEGVIDALQSHSLTGPPSVFTCPECGGTLWELHDGELTRYRCHVGHGYTAQSLLEHQTNGLEEALWTALRTLEEHAALGRRLAKQARERNSVLSADRFDRLAEEKERHAAVVREILLKDEPGPPKDPLPKEPATPPDETGA